MTDFPIARLSSSSSKKNSAIMAKVLIKNIEISNPYDLFVKEIDLKIHVFSKEELHEGKFKRFGVFVYLRWMC